MTTKQQIKEELKVIAQQLETLEKEEFAEPVVAKTNKKTEGVVAEETEVASKETSSSFASVLDLTVKVSPTVQMAIDQAADRLIRDKANFPDLSGV